MSLRSSHTDRDRKLVACRALQSQLRCSAAPASELGRGRTRRRRRRPPPPVADPAITKIARQQFVQWQAGVVNKSLYAPQVADRSSPTQKSPIPRGALGAARRADRHGLHRALDRSRLPRRRARLHLSDALRLRKRLPLAGARRRRARSRRSSSRTGSTSRRSPRAPARLVRPRPARCYNSGIPMTIAELIERVRRYDPSADAAAVDARLRARRRRSPGPAARLGRVVHRASAGRRRNPRRARDGPPDDRRRAAARRRRGHVDHQRAGRPNSSAKRSRASSTASPS